MQQIIQYKSSTDVPSTLFRKDDELNDNIIRSPNAVQAFSVPAPKKSLPQKKRFTKKLKCQEESLQPTLSNGYILTQEVLPAQQANSLQTGIIKQVDKGVSSGIGMLAMSPQALQGSMMAQNQFSCELCGLQFTRQLEFFSHLKQHYEPVVTIPKSEDSNCMSTEVNLDIYRRLVEFLIRFRRESKLFASISVGSQSTAP